MTPLRCRRRGRVIGSPSRFMSTSRLPDARHLSTTHCLTLGRRPAQTSPFAPRHHQLPRSFHSFRSFWLLLHLGTGTQSTPSRPGEPTLIVSVQTDMVRSMLLHRGPRPPRGHSSAVMLPVEPHLSLFVGQQGFAAGWTDPAFCFL
jgi:hypothetical protein